MAEADVDVHRDATFTTFVGIPTFLLEFLYRIMLIPYRKLTRIVSFPSFVNNLVAPLSNPNSVEIKVRLQWCSELLLLPFLFRNKGIVLAFYKVFP